jgi:hypothetical protein
MIRESTFTKVKVGPLNGCSSWSTVGPAAGNAQAASATPSAAATPDTTAVLWRRHHGNDKSTS